MKRGATIRGSGFRAAAEYGSVKVVVTTKVGKSNSKSFKVKR